MPALTLGIDCDKMIVVSANDDLPWYPRLLVDIFRVEKYRPSTMDEIYYHVDILNSCKNYYLRPISESVY